MSLREWEIRKMIALLEENNRDLKKQINNDDQIGLRQLIQENDEFIKKLQYLLDKPLQERG